MRVFGVRGALAAAVVFTLPAAAHAQRASENAITEAEDAFGGMVGVETVGIYDETNVRGLNPQQAGNARIDNAYFDQLATFPGRLRRKTTIRVGFAALDYVGPAPTGIVAYDVRRPAGKFVAATSLQAVQYGGYVGELDMMAPTADGRFSLGLGGATGQTETADGARTHYASFSFIPAARVGGIELKALAGGIRNLRQDTRPIITTSGAFLPPLAATGRYLGQSWANNRNDNVNFGVMAKAPLADGLEVRASLFRSQVRRVRNFTELYAVQAADGAARHRLLADPRQNSYADSWEALAQYRFGDGALRHSIAAGARGRSRHIESGGSQTFDFGPVVYGVADPEPKPTLAFGAVNLGRLTQTNYTAGYIGRYANRAQLNLGVTKAVYDATFRGATGASSSQARPLLWNASLLVRPAGRLAIYAGYVKGLEDNGSAPENAANRNQQLPASRTHQMDAGVKIDVAQMHVVVSAFEIEKPYFSFDAANRYDIMGDVRHRGLEISAAGALTPHLRVLGGAVIMDPVVSGPARDLGRVGPRPVGVPKVRGRLDLNYTLPAAPRMTLNATGFYDGPRAASAAPYAALGGRQLFLPSRAVLDLGLRYAFKAGDHPASLRAVVANVFDKRGWKVLSSNSFQPDDYRRFNLYLNVDY